MLAKPEIERLKTMLERQLKDLQNELAKNSQPKDAPALADINDQASFESERSFELRIKDRERKLVNKVMEALKKIGDGTYGTCESCSEEIGFKRLEARPVTNLCINCKSEMEKEERREETMAQYERRNSTSTLS